MARLTEEMVRDARTSKVREEIPDTDVGGLRLRITQTGAKSWVVLRRVKGKGMVRLTLGKWPAIKLADARKLARTAVNEMASGTDPRDRLKFEAAREMTVEQAMEAYLELRRGRLKVSTATDYKRMLGAEMKGLKDKRVVDLNTEIIVAWHSAFKGRKTADKAARVLRAVLRYASDRYGLVSPNGKVATDALRTLRLWTPPTRKQRVIGDLPAWREAVETCPTAIRDLFLCLAVTGLRRDELRLAEWSQLDLKAGTLHLPDPKNRKPVTLPLPEQALEILMTRRAADKGATRAFSNDGATPVGLKTIARWLERTSEALGARWSPHDLRRGYLTVAASIAPAYVVKRLAHHAMPASDPTAGYVQLDVEALRPWAQQVADLVLDNGQVVHLSRRAS